MIQEVEGTQIAGRQIGQGVSGPRSGGREHPAKPVLDQGAQRPSGLPRMPFGTGKTLIVDVKHPLHGPQTTQVWEVYRGGGDDNMVSSAFKPAQDDLVALSPPRGLSEDLFTAYVTGILRQMPLLTEIDKLASTGLTDTKAHEFLSDQLVDYAGETSEFGRIWRIVKLWLVHFFPESYRLETGQEVLVRGREIPRR